MNCKNMSKRIIPKLFRMDQTKKNTMEKSKLLFEKTDKF